MTKPKKYLCAVLFGAAALLATQAAALDFTNEDVRSAGMGGALRSTAYSTSGLFLNPAGLAMAKLYHIEASYLYDHPYKMHFVGASVVDSITSSLAVGLGYYYRKIDKSGYELQAHEARLALAFPILNILGIGVTCKYMRSKNEMHLAEGASSPFGHKLNSFSLDIGLQARFLKYFSLGVVGYNLTKIDTPLAPLSFGMSAAVQIKSFQVGFDALLDWSSYSGMKAKYMVGAEYFLIGHIPLRAGYSYNDGEKSHTIHGGTGFISKIMSIEIALAGEANAGTDKMKEFRFLVSLKYFLN